jgi:single-stranded-DNA-specific exonuclease
MNINPIYSNINDISIESYLSYYGVENPTEYMKGNSVEPNTHYDCIDAFCSVLHIWLKYNNKMYLLVDPDVDGYFSASMFYSYCKLINPDCNIIPIFHEGKGHGLSDDTTFRQAKLIDEGLLVILDAGSNDKSYIKKLCIPCIIADHHDVENRSDLILVNNQLSKNVINKGLSGCGVTWKCLSRYDELYGYKYAKQFISYVMITLLSDSCPLNYNEQYTFIKWGKKQIHPFLQPFIDRLNNDETNKGYSFGLIPCINALNRLGTMEDKEELFKALCGEINADNIIDKCISLHNKQSNEAKKIADNAEIITDKQVVLAKINESTTLTGLVANKLMGKYSKPIILVHNNEANDQFDGSVRSPIDLRETFNSTKLFMYASGHPCAFGVGYKKDNEQNIVNYLDNQIKLCEPYETVLIKLKVNSLTNKLFAFNESYKEYFGNNIPIPNIYIDKFKPDDIQDYGKVIRITKGDVRFVLFYPTNEQKEMFKKSNIYIDIIGEPCYNVFNGKKEKQIIINKFEVSKNKKQTLEDIF